jgi:hypothetical protein
MTGCWPPLNETERAATCPHIYRLASAGACYQLEKVFPQSAVQVFDSSPPWDNIRGCVVTASSADHSNPSQ